MPSGLTQKWSVQLRVAGGDVAGGALAEAEEAEEAEGRGQPLLAVPPLVGHVESNFGKRVRGSDRTPSARAYGACTVRSNMIGRWTSRSPNPNATWSSCAATSPRRRSRSGRRGRGRRSAATPTSCGRWASSGCSACWSPRSGAASACRPSGSWPPWSRSVWPTSRSPPPGRPTSPSARCRCSCSATTPSATGGCARWPRAGCSAPSASPSPTPAPTPGGSPPGPSARTAAG